MNVDEELRKLRAVHAAIAARAGEDARLRRVRGLLCERLYLGDDKTPPMSTRDIAAAIGVTHPTVLRWIQLEGGDDGKGAIPRKRARSEKAAG